MQHFDTFVSYFCVLLRVIEFVCPILLCTHFFVLYLMIYNWQNIIEILTARTNWNNAGADAVAVGSVKAVNARMRL